MDVSGFIDESYKKLDNASVSKRVAFNTLFTIIELKVQNPSLLDYRRSLYIDVKAFLTAYCTYDPSHDFGYDRLLFEKIENVIEQPSFSDEKKYLLYSYVLTLVSDIQIDVLPLKEKKSRYYLRVAKKRNRLKYLLLLSSSSSTSIVITILLLFIIEACLLLPAPFPWMSMFVFDTTEICKDSFFNHVGNVLALHLDSLNISSVTPTNFFAVFLIALWHVAFIVIVVSFLFEKLLTKIHIDESE